MKADIKADASGPSSSVISASSFLSEESDSSSDGGDSFHSDESYYDELEDFNIAPLNEEQKHEQEIQSHTQKKVVHSNHYLIKNKFDNLNMYM